MNFKSICRLIRLDYESIPHNGGIVHTYISSQAFRILFWLRLGGGNKIFHLLSRTILHRLVIGNNSIELGTKIGKGLFLAHPISIVISCKSIIGDYVWIHQDVTIGNMYGKGSPIIGNNVLLFAGAKIIGNVRIGNNVVVGANAVVTHDVPENAVVVGIPAKVINYNGKEINKMYKPFLKD